MHTRDQLINVTAEAIQKKGFHGTGITEILRKAQVPKGSLYHHFANGKQQLVRESLEFAAKERARVFITAMKGKKTAVEGLQAVVDVFMGERDQDGKFIGCPLAVVSMEIALGDESLREVCADLYTFWQKGIEDYLVYKKIDRAGERAENFFVQLEGALLFSRVHQSLGYLERFKQKIDYILS